MLGWLIAMPGGKAAGVPAFIATVNLNQTSEGITAGPGAPTELTAAAGNAQVTLSWTAPESDGGASIVGYYIYEGTTPGGESNTAVPSSYITGCTPIGSTGSCTVTGLENGTAYYFKVAAVNDLEAVGPMSDEVSATPFIRVGPAAPTGLTATAGDTQVSLSWTAPASNGGPQVTSYDIYDGTTADFKTATLAGNSASTSYTVPDLTDGTTYYFWVAAVNAVDQSAPSSPASATPVAPPVSPAAPSGLTATAGDTKVTLSWTAPASSGSSQVTSYNIYDGTTADFKTATLAGNSASTSYTVPDLTDGTTYYFWVTAVNTVGPSPASSPASATPVAPPVSPATTPATPATTPATPATTPATPAATPATPATTPATRAATPATPAATPATPATTPAGPSASPAAPTGLTATAGDTQVSLYWTAPASNGGPQVTSYNIYDGTTADFKTATLAGSSAGPGATVTRLTDGTTYYFWVTAVNTAGHESPSSADASARPDPSGPVSKLLIAVLAAIATMVVAGALTLAARGRRLNSRSRRHVTPASDVRAVPGPRLPDAVDVRQTGGEPTHTVRFEPDRGTITTTIKEES